MRNVPAIAVAIRHPITPQHRHNTTRRLCAHSTSPSAKKSTTITTCLASLILPAWSILVAFGIRISQSISASCLPFAFYRAKWHNICFGLEPGEWGFGLFFARLLSCRCSLLSFGVNQPESRPELHVLCSIAQHREMTTTTTDNTPTRNILTTLHCAFARPSSRVVF